ncbi:CehA/McbA family metallohydrolase [Flexivirga meconopsidis]|uniref:CehA/McbA family metallohydrolase n=1 Tax=Flexivirga meconopsidis TaxID=2977121 RepID=UPI00223F5760|nr:CehA/McbA family metallohydrolase [Flexivirga meconopsidis]
MAPGISRRTMLRAGGAGAVVAAANLLPGVAFAEAPAGTAPTSKTVTGHFGPGNPDFYYLPVEVPRGVNRIDVSYTYDKPSVPAGRRGNACDIGMFGPEGTKLGDRKAFRGWSGGFRTEFFITAGEATPGYLAGPIKPGTWHVILGPYTVAPQGMDYSVTIKLSYGAAGPAFTATPAPTSAPKRQRGKSWYRGDGHLHTVHSDGRRTPEQLVADARAAGLDFVVSTEHNTPSAQLVWGKYATEDLLILNGEEVTTRSGHWPAIGLPAGTWLDWRYRADDRRDFQRFVDQTHKAGGLVTAAHPFANCFACSFEFPYEPADLIEVWNGPWSAEDDAAVTHWDGLLRTGTFIPAIGDSDAHSPGDTIGLPHTVVWADSLERRALLRGLAAGRSYLAADQHKTLDLRASAGRASAGIGETVSSTWGTAVTFTCHATGFSPGTTLTVFDQLGPETSTQLPSGSGTLTWTTDSRYSKWARVEVRRADRTMEAMSNPIFVTGQPAR